MLSSLTFFDISIDGCVVAQLHQVNVFVGIIVEENGRAGLALEVNTVLVLIRDLGDFNLDFGLFIDRIYLWLSFNLLVNLLLTVKSELPVGVRNLELLSLLLEFRAKLSK